MNKQDYYGMAWSKPAPSTAALATSAIQLIQWYRKIRIKGPIAGRLYVCYRHDKPGKTATAITPEGAYNAWQSYWGTEA